MADKNYAYRQKCVAPNLADFLPNPPTSSVTAGSVVWVATINENDKADLDAYMASRAFEYIGEISTVPAKTAHWGALAAQPTGVGLVISEGDTFYDTALNTLKVWDGAAWVSS